MEINIHKDLKTITDIALHYAKKHNCNYNVIIQNPVDDQFDENLSTYEFVKDSYIESHLSTDYKLVTSTNNLNNNMSFNDDDPFDNNNTYNYINPYINILNDDMIHHMLPERINPIVRDSPKIGRNELCKCDSGKKYKKCCINKLTNDK